MPFVGPTACFFQAAVTTDGCMDLVTIPGNISPVTAVKIMFAVETPQFFDNPHISYKKISAYRIIPRNQKQGCISIDGESLPFEPFQCEVHQGLARVITKRGVFEAEGPLGWDKDARLE
jgi:sphingosine kinase